MQRPSPLPSYNGRSNSVVSSSGNPGILTGAAAWTQAPLRTRLQALLAVAPGIVPRRSASATEDGHSATAHCTRCVRPEGALGFSLVLRMGMSAWSSYALHLGLDSESSESTRIHQPRDYLCTAYALFYSKPLSPS